MSMDRSSIVHKIVTIVAEQISKPSSEVKEDATFDSLGLDSLDRVEIVMKIEEEFGIEMNDERVDKICTLPELISYVLELQHK